MTQRPAIGTATALGALIALAALLRFPTLDLQSFWFDETVTVVDVLRPSLAATLARLPSQELAPPLYFILAWAWSQPFGIGEVGLRSLSALIGTLTVPVAYAAGRELVSRRAGLAAAALVAVSPLLVYYSQEARPYALVILLGGLSLWTWARALEPDSSLSWLAAWALVAVLALLTHYFAAFLLAPQALWLLVRASRHRGRVSPTRGPSMGGAGGVGVRRPRGPAPTLAAVGAVGATGVALLPLALAQLGSGGATWIGRTPLAARLLELPEKIAGGWQSAYNPAWPLPALLMAVGLWLLVTRGDGRERRGAAVAFALAGAALAIPLAMTVAGLDFFTFRHLIVVAVPLLVGLGAGFGVRRAGRVGPLALAALCAGSLAINGLVLATPRLQRDDWRAASAALGRPTMVRVLVFTSFTREPVQAYGHRVEEEIPPSTRVGEIALIGNTVEGAPPPPPPVAGFRLVERRRIQKLTLTRYRAARPLPVNEAALVRGLGRFPHAVVLERP